MGFGVALTWGKRGRDYCIYLAAPAGIQVMLVQVHVPIERCRVGTFGECMCMTMRTNKLPTERWKYLRDFRTVMHRAARDDRYV